ncbi:MAG: YidB family protein, partial [Methylocella sp.]
LGPKASPLVHETLGLISGQPGGMGGFLEMFKAAGFAAEVASWSGGTEVVPLSGEEVEQTLGSGVIGEIADKVDISQSFARTIMGYAIPKIIVLLAQGEAVPPAIPASESSVLDSAIPLSRSPVEELMQPGAEQIRPSRTEHFAAAPLKAPSRFKQLFAYGSRAALAACLLGFAWAAGAYFSSGQLPFYAVTPPPAPVATQESVARAEMLRATQEMAEDIRGLKANVEALRAAQSQSGNEAAALEGLKTRLDAVNTETSASIAALAGKVEDMQREPAAKLSQIIERLDRIEHQSAAPLATASLGAASGAGKPAAGKPAQSAVAPAKPPLENAHAQRKIAGRGDAFDPSQNPTAPGVPRPLGSLAPAASTPRLITNWVVRDVYNGIALVESPRGSIEVAPGEIIPGAGVVKSIERRGGGWIVITSRGLIDSARDSFQP